MTKVLVVGGGVAGCATALALHQAGIPAVVYEAHPSGGDDAGAFLTVMANGMAAEDAGPHCSPRPDRLGFFRGRMLVPCGRAAGPDAP